ncbi:hypothetical protein A0J61_00242 [Choanephora cucurbitarum]|uniref:Secreted protein n=1 Tax=Choanephora cucurbitarum TaxID=101091 RepID=A0A1C7NRN0_9FUNG|nr:hypothetical protein A0J61_00242 [Choanephora cucurbitarum]
MFTNKNSESRVAFLIVLICLGLIFTDSNRHPSQFGQESHKRSAFDQKPTCPSKIDLKQQQQQQRSKE